MQSTDSLEPTGERFIPELMGGALIEAEHQARYRLALPFVKGKRVLDAGCGTGWGSKLLLEAGAASVVGLDLSPEAVADSRSRVPDAEFVEGNLEDLQPLEDASFDVVVCFEALEHTHDTSKALDSLARVLVADGLLFVSSPNPAVYPAGNPFHFHEMPLAELHEAVASRFANVAMYRQHVHLASTLVVDGAGASTFDTVAFPVQGLPEGNDPYSVAVASNGKLPRIKSAQALAPSDQLTHLGALSAALAEERQTLTEGYQSVVDERVTLLATIADLNERLTTAGADLGRVMAERDAATESLSELETLRRRVDQLAEDRDRFALKLVQAEQELFLVRDDETSPNSVANMRARLERAATRSEELAREVHAIHDTVSWRVTGPLRMARTIAARYGK